MKITINTNSGVPIYRQLLEQIRFQIASGVLAPGQELPSTRNLSAELGLNPMTVSKVYTLLEDDRLVDRRPGLPLVVSELGGRRDREVRLDRLAGEMEALARKVRQLEVPAEEALALFRLKLDEAGENENSRRRT